MNNPIEGCASKDFTLEELQDLRDRAGDVYGPLGRYAADILVQLNLGLSNKSLKQTHGFMLHWIEVRKEPGL